MTSPMLEHYATRFFAAVDAQQAQKLRPYLTPDVTFQLANAPTSTGIDALVEAFAATESLFTSITHDIQGVWSGVWTQGHVISVEANVHYRHVTGEYHVLPVTSTLRLNDQNKICDYRIFMDPSPIFN